MSIQFLRGDEESISNSARVPLSGQPVYNTDSNLLYIGDNSTEIKNLSPINSNVANFAKNVTISNTDSGDNPNVSFSIGNGMYSKVVNNVEDAINVTGSINGNSLQSIFSSDGITVKESLNSNSSAYSENSFRIVGYPISMDTDMNDLIPSISSSDGKSNIEIHTCNDQSVINTLVNCPTSNYFTMTSVRFNGSDTNSAQQCIIDESGAVYSRSGSNGVFSDWSSSLSGRIEDITDLIVAESSTTTIYSGSSNSGTVYFPNNTISKYYAFYIRIKVSTGGEYVVPLFYRWYDQKIQQSYELSSYLFVGNVLSKTTSDDSGRTALGFFQFNSTARVVSNTFNDKMDFTDCSLTAITTEQGWVNGVSSQPLNVLYAKGQSTTISINGIWGVRW